MKAKVLPSNDFTLFDLIFFNFDIVQRPATSPFLEQETYLVYLIGFIFTTFHQIAEAGEAPGGYDGVDTFPFSKKLLKL